MPGILLKNITKSFTANRTNKTVLDDISLEIKDGSFCVLLGPSGCGKSTLLRIIAGLETLDSGEIFIDNKKMNEVLPKNRDIAFVFQNYALYPHLNVFDNISFPLKIRKTNKNEIEQKVNDVAEILGLKNLLHSKPKELSGGQRQRVALGRAMVRQPKVFLLDEPLSNLDTKLRKDMRFELKKLQRKLNTTFIYVTHDQTEALTMGDEIVILNEGKILQQAAPDKILAAPKNTFVASFSGIYPMNLIDCEIKNGKIISQNFTFDIPLKYENSLLKCQKVTAAIRPENISVVKIPNSFKCIFTIDFIENTGMIKILHLNNQILAVANSGEKFAAKQEFYINPNDFIFFDFYTKNLIECD